MNGKNVSSLLMNELGVSKDRKKTRTNNHFSVCVTGYVIAFDVDYTFT